MTNNVVQTLEGFYSLHQFFQVDWEKWNKLNLSEKEDVLDDFLHILKRWNEEYTGNNGSSAIFTIIGHKADILLLHLRETITEIQDLETLIKKSKFHNFLIYTYAHLAMVELSFYTGEPNPAHPEVQKRLKFVIPDQPYLCFYPMNKRRSMGDNWYMLSMDERSKMMQSHGQIGRNYAGKVTQLITGSVGLDDWEWGVTLFSKDPLQFKKIVYEMRFDEVSARFGEFGPFYVGEKIDKNKLKIFLL